MLRIGEGRVYVDLVAVGNQAGLSSDRTETCWKWGPVWWWQVAKNMRVDAAAAASLAAVQLGHVADGHLLPGRRALPWCMVRTTSVLSPHHLFFLLAPPLLRIPE